jgi:hypothetical protein
VSGITLELLVGEHGGFDAGTVVHARLFSTSSVKFVMCETCLAILHKR